MPPLSRLVESMLGTVTGGAVRALLFGCVFDNANASVSNAPESMTNAIRLLTFIGVYHCFHLLLRKLPFEVLESFVLKIKRCNAVRRAPVRSKRSLHVLICFIVLL